MSLSSSASKGFLFSNLNRNIVFPFLQLQAKGGKKLSSRQLMNLQKEDECKISNNNYVVVFQFNFQVQKV